MLLKSFSLGSLSAFLIKALILGAMPGDAVISIFLMILLGYALFLEEKKEPVVNKDVKDRLVEIETSLAETKSKVSAITLGSLNGRYK